MTTKVLIISIRFVIQFKSRIFFGQKLTSKVRYKRGTIQTIVDQGVANNKSKEEHIRWIKFSQGGRSSSEKRVSATQIKFLLLILD